jgi:hypothetical protein
MGTLCVCFEKYNKQLSEHRYSHMNSLGIYIFSLLLSAADIKSNRGQMGE